MTRIALDFISFYFALAAGPELEAHGDGRGGSGDDRCEERGPQDQGRSASESE